MATEADAPAAAGVPDVVLYARVWPRVKAILVDWFIIMAAFLIAALVGTHVRGAGAAAFVAWLGVWALYDPLMVWLTGGTVGHHALNLRVVADRTGGRPSLPAALVRNVAKTFFGAVSLLAMAASSRSKALHDWVAGTTVQARDAAGALSRDFTKVRLLDGQTRFTLRVGGAIPAERVRLVGPDGAPLGVVDIGDALRRAAAAGLELIEINRNAAPPVCKIMDRRKLEAAIAEKARARKPEGPA
ncbi:MAG TPA: RDD family protein [Polyangia bacterium]|nr:RDD family protein [Polyangia bacterium]